MKRFERNLTIGEWTKHPGIRHLFSHWALPGEPSGPKGLRIGVRDGYLNLYVRGQSVAKLTGGKDVARLEVHPVYVLGLRKGCDRSAAGISLDKYCKFSTAPNGSAADFSEADVDRWIATAATYSGAEKAFVDDLVAANPGTIDLEMGLPANTGQNTAPRMDLVLAQDGNVAFWEAKCSDNGELRAKAEVFREDEHGKYKQGIHVVHQLLKYVRWMDAMDCDRRSEVVAAYQEAARVLLELADRFGKYHAPATEAWRKLRNADPQVILSPGVVIGNYCAKNQDDVPFSRAADGNTEYIKRLRERQGIVVHEIARGDQGLLPNIQSHVIRP